MATHFTAVLTIVRTDDRVIEPTPRFHDRATEPARRERDSAEELKLTIRAATLAELTENLAAHTALLKKGNV